jgi:hypothetical protein
VFDSPPTPPPALVAISVSNRSTPYAGDRRLLTTVSPNADGFRDHALVRFTLTAPALVRMDVVRTDMVGAGKLAARVIFSKQASLVRGRNSLQWTPKRNTQPRTYILRLTVSARGRSRVYGAYRPGGAVDAPVVRVQGIDAGFLQPSYAPGDAAQVRVGTDATSLRVQVFAYGNQLKPTERDIRLGGRAMTQPVQLDWRAHRDAPAVVQVARAGDWPSGIYFLRITGSDGRVGYAPFIVRPRVLGSTSRVAVVLATNTWQAYNFRDEDGDGWGDSWYVSGTVHSVDLTRPFLDFGVPFRFGDWDLTFIAWLAQTAKKVEFLTDADLDRIANGDELARNYDLIVFPGHEEYATEHTYDAVQRFRDLGGNLMFLSANNFFWKVRRSGNMLTRVKLWRNLGRPEAGLVGVQYVGSNHGSVQKPYVVEGATVAPWAFAGTGLANGSSFGAYGIEIDARSSASPPGTAVLARVPNALGNGADAEMTYYETAAGAKVFASGTLDFASSLDRQDVSRLVDGVWARLAAP